MPLVKGDATCTTGMAKAVYDALIATTATTSIIAGAGTKAFAHAIAAAIYDEITTNAQVLPTALVAPVGGGAVTGTGTIT